MSCESIAASHGTPPENSMQRTPRRAAADGDRYAAINRRSIVLAGVEPGVESAACGPKDHTDASRHPQVQ